MSRRALPPFHPSPIILTMQTNNRTSSSAPCAERDHSHEIGLLAYHLWEAAGRPTGEDVKYWLQAEEQLLGRHHLNGQTPPPRSSRPKQRGVPVFSSKHRVSSAVRKTAGPRAAS